MVISGFLFYAPAPHLKETLVSAGHVTRHMPFALGGGDNQLRLATGDVPVVLSRRHYEEWHGYTKVFI